MASQVEQLRASFNKLNTTQKKEFIDKLRAKLQGSTNTEYRNFLNECVKKYNAGIQRNAEKSTNTIPAKTTTPTKRQDVSHFDSVKKQEVSQTKIVKDNIKPKSKNVIQAMRNWKPIHLVLFLSMAILLLIFLVSIVSDLMIITLVSMVPLIIIFSIEMTIIVNNDGSMQTELDSLSIKARNVANFRDYAMKAIGGKKHHTVTCISKHGLRTSLYLWRDGNNLRALPLNEHGFSVENIEILAKGRLIGFGADGGYGTSPLDKINFCRLEGGVSKELQVTGGEGFSKTGAIVGGLISGSTGAIIGGLAAAEPLKIETSTIDSRCVGLYYNGGYGFATFAYDDFHAFMDLIPEKCR